MTKKKTGTNDVLHSPVAGWLLALPTLVFSILLLVLPLWRTMTEAGLNLNIWQDSYFINRLLWTLWQAALSAGFALVLGAPLAYLLARYQMAGKELFLRLLLLPFVTPTLVAVLGLSALLGPQGWLTRLLNLQTDLSETPVLLILGNLFFNLPVMIRLAYMGFSRLSPTLLESARNLGAGAWRTALQIALPLALPSLGAGFLLVFLYSALSFGLPLALAGEAYATLEVEIYTLTALQLRLSEASALIFGQLIFVLLVSAVYSRLRGGVGVSFRQLPPLRGKVRVLFGVLLAVVLCICFGPLLAVLGRSILSTSGFTLDYWQGIWHDEQTLMFLKNTVLFGVLALITSSLLGVSYALGTWLARSRALDVFSLLPLMVSPVSLAVGYLLAYPTWAATLPMLISAYTLLALPLLIRSLLAAFHALPLRLFEAARTLGATTLKSHRKLTLPLSFPSFRGGAALALATILGEFGATLVLTRPEWGTLSTGLYERLGRPGEQNLGEACALASVLLLLASLTFWWLDGGKGEIS